MSILKNGDFASQTLEHWRLNPDGQALRFEKYKDRGYAALIPRGNVLLQEVSADEFTNHTHFTVELLAKTPAGPSKVPGGNPAGSAEPAHTKTPLDVFLLFHLPDGSSSRSEEKRFDVSAGMQRFTLAITRRPSTLSRVELWLQLPDHAPDMAKEYDALDVWLADIQLNVVD